jgi:hypothetical protein
LDASSVLTSRQFLKRILDFAKPEGRAGQISNGEFVCFRGLNLVDDVSRSLDEDRISCAETLCNLSACVLQLSL